MRPLILPPQIGNDKVGISIKIRCQFPGFGNIGNISLAEEINVHTFGNQRGRHAEQISAFNVGGNVVADNEHIFRQESRPAHKR